MSEDIFYADATTLASRIRDRSLSPVEVVQAHLDRIKAVNPGLNALIAFPDGVMDRAREAEAAIMRGESWDPLHGVPFTVKDCVDTAGVVTTRGSRLFETHVPAADATVVRRLKEAGGIFIAKSNMPEFALWWETDNLVYGRTENPWMAGRTPGGSSGGEAAAVASGMSPLGIGSDVGGSIREPANYCGIVGLKATHGRIPLTGHWPDTAVVHNIAAIDTSAVGSVAGRLTTTGFAGLWPHQKLPPEHYLLVAAPTATRSGVTWGSGAGWSRTVWSSLWALTPGQPSPQVEAFSGWQHRSDGEEGCSDDPATPWPWDPDHPPARRARRLRNGPCGFVSGGAS